MGPYNYTNIEHQFYTHVHKNKTMIMTKHKWLLDKNSQTLYNDITELKDFGKKKKKR